MRVSELARKPVDGDGRRTPTKPSPKDDPPTSPLASEAIVDSRGFEVLNAEELEELKKVRPDARAVYNPRLNMASSYRNIRCYRRG